VLSAGRVVMAGTGAELACNPDVGRLFLGSFPDTKAAENLPQDVIGRDLSGDFA
jgi:hypothetical protein